MDIYSRKSRWKWYLALAGAIIVLISAVYSSYLAGELAKEERKKVEQYFAAQKELNKEIPEEALQYIDFTFFANMLESNTTIPVMLYSEEVGIIDARNFGSDDSLFLDKKYKSFLANNVEPIEGEYGTKLYFDESTLLKQLRFFPYVQFFLIGVFILFGYLAFSSARRAQENQVWVGMAKETAHQLGTPTMAIIGWIEHLKMIREDDEEILEITQELRNDVTRLELIANRFSKIGSEPELQPIDIYEELEICRVYMQRRAPRKVAFDFPKPNENEPILVQINPPLFDWVVENLLRNALDAMGGKGKITAVVYEDADYAFIDISDTGKGIPSNKFKTVFNPGFTTKKRGWGLGLSLAKRIIVEYHTGKIFVKKSSEGEGTTFTIQLPKK